MPQTRAEAGGEPGPGASGVTAEAGRAGRRGEGLALLALLVTAAAVRVFSWHRTAVLFNDGPIFLALSDAWLEGRLSALLAHPYHPLYPAAIAAVRAVSGLAPEPAAVAVSIAGGLLAVLGVGLAVRWAFDREAGWMAAWTVALHPWAVDFSSDVMSDGLYAGLFLIGFAALVAWQHRPTGLRAVAVGGAAALAYLVRPEGLGLLGVAVGVGAFTAWRRPSLRRPLAATGALALLTAALATTPFVLALHDQLGDWTLTRKKSLEDLTEGRAGVRIDVAGVPRSASASQTDPSRPRSAATAAHPGPHAGSRVPLPRSSERLDGNGYDRPPRSVAGAFEALSRAVRTSLAAFRYELVSFALIGAFAAGVRRVPERAVAFGLPALIYTALLVLLVWGAGYVARRHALAAWLPLTAYAVLGWRALVGRLRPSFRGDRGGAIVLLVLVLVVVWGPRDLRARRADRAPVRAAAEWLAEHAGPQPIVAAQKLRVAYYAKGRHVPLPSGVEAPIEGRLRAAGVEWVVIDDRRLADHAGLVEGIGDWLEPVHREEAGGRRVLVLRVR